MKEDYVLFDDITTVELIKFIRSEINPQFKIRDLASSNILEEITIDTVGLNNPSEQEVRSHVQNMINGDLPNLKIMYKGKEVCRYKANITFNIYESKNGEFIKNQNEQIIRVNKLIK